MNAWECRSWNQGKMLERNNISQKDWFIMMTNRGDEEYDEKNWEKSGIVSDGLVFWSTKIFATDGDIYDACAVILKY